MRFDRPTCPFCDRGIDVTTYDKLEVGAYVVVRCDCEGEDGCWGRNPHDALRRLVDIRWHDFRKKEKP